MAVSNGKVEWQRAIIGLGLCCLRVEVGNLLEDASVRDRQHDILVHSILVAKVPARPTLGPTATIVAIIFSVLCLFCLFSFFGVCFCRSVGLVNTAFAICACEITTFTIVLTYEVRVRQATVAGCAPVTIIDALLGMAGGNVKHNATCTDAIAATSLVVEFITKSIHAHCDELGVIPESHVGKQTLIGTPTLA